MASIEQISTLFGELSFADKLSFMADAANMLKKEGKSAAKASGKKGAAKDGKEPKKASAGVLAWQAFHKKCKTEHAERYEDIKLEKEKLAISKAIREEDEDAYKLFVENFKESHSIAASAEASETEKTPTPVAAPPKKEVKVAAAAKKEVKVAAAPAAAKKEVAVKPVVSELQAKKDAAKAKAAAAKAKKEAEAKSKKEPEEEETMLKKIIDGEEYFWCKDTNGLWKVEEDDAFGPWVGKFQKDNAEEPIRFTDSPADD